MQKTFCFFSLKKFNSVGFIVFGGFYWVLGFYAPQLYRQVLLWRVLAMGILSVRPSVCLSVRQSVTTLYGFKAR